MKQKIPISFIENNQMEIATLCDGYYLCPVSGLDPNSGMLYHSATCREYPNFVNNKLIINIL